MRSGSNRPGQRKVAACCAAVLLVCLVYVMAYLLTVSPKERIIGNSEGVHHWFEARYAGSPMVNACFTLVFAPIHSIDRRIRHRCWASRDDEGEDLRYLLLQKGPAEPVAGSDGG